MRTGVAAVVTLLLVVSAGCSSGGRSRRLDREGAGTTTTTAPGSPSADDADHPRGGSVRVGVPEEADPAAPTLGGAAVRDLVLPQLFEAQPDGSWAPSLVQPGSARLAADKRSVTFRVRPRAVWSDGSPITAADLQRTRDGRFVRAVAAAADGRVSVSFTSPQANWQRLWSGADSVGPPRPGVWGGPFVIAGSTPGLDVVLRRNDRWYGGSGPFLDEVRLVLVPDATTALQLLQRGELDVVMPPASTNRTPFVRAYTGVTVDAGPVASVAGGWWTGLVLNGAKVPVDLRRALVASVDRSRFVGVLLRGEASVLDGLAGRGDRTWAGSGSGPASAALAPLRSGSVDVVGEQELPMTALLQRSMQRRASATDGSLQVRLAEAALVQGWLRTGEYQGATVPLYDPAGGCWTCRWGGVDGGLAAAADGGEAGAVAQLEARLRDDALVVPLWRPRPVVAWRTTAVHGPAANGYALSGAWNAQTWWR